MLRKIWCADAGARCRFALAQRTWLSARSLRASSSPSSTARAASGVCRAAMANELYCYSWHPRTSKALIPAKLGGVELKIHEVTAAETKSAEFLKLNPAGKARAGSCLLSCQLSLPRNELRQNTRLRILLRLDCGADCRANLRNRSRCSRRRRARSSSPTPSLATSPASATTAFSAPPRSRRCADAEYSLHAPGTTAVPGRREEVL